MLRRSYERDEEIAELRRQLDGLERRRGQSDAREQNARFEEISALQDSIEDDQGQLGMY